MSAEPTSTLHNFDPTPLIDRLERAEHALPAMARIASEPDAKWKPAPSDRFPSGAWSILEICCHMLYEETEDFRTRLRLTQEDPAAPWPGWDPEGHAVRERYNEQSLPVVLDAWVRERKATVRWLRELVGSGRADWFVAYNHPRVGPVRAGVLLVGWAAHDALHLRQISKRLFELAERDGKGPGFETDYAGKWGA